VKKYFESFLEEFQTPENLTLRIMKSDGGFKSAPQAKASELLLSGPAGGLIGCKSIIPAFERVSRT
jgi:N-methylhydantoinase A/oxoprolinase/acetone carboxylase beta subunit